MQYIELNRYIKPRDINIDLLGVTKVSTVSWNISGIRPCKGAMSLQDLTRIPFKVV